MSDQYCKIVKVEALSGNVVYNAIGYINYSDKDSFEAIQGFAFNNWVNENPTQNLSVYFDTNGPCYLVDTTISINGLSLIVNFENPEG